MQYVTILGGIMLFGYILNHLYLMKKAFKIETPYLLMMGAAYAWMPVGLGVLLLMIQLPALNKTIGSKHMFHIEAFSMYWVINLAVAISIATHLGS